MKIGLWNCRGIGRKNLWSDIKATCKINKIKMLALVETKSFEGPSKNIWRKAGFDFCHVVPANGYAGGLCLLWKSYQMLDGVCEIAFSTSRFIAVKYKILSLDRCLMLVFAYAPLERLKKIASRLSLKGSFKTALFRASLLVT